MLYSVHGRIGSGIHPENEIRVGGGGEGKGLRFFGLGKKRRAGGMFRILLFILLFPFFSGGEVLYF